MELRPGYKQTEVGVIPEDWASGHLDQFWSVLDCKHVTADFVANGFPVASIKEVKGLYVDLTHANHTNQKYYKLLIDGGRQPRTGDLIISRNATVGEVAQVADWHPPFAMGQDVCLIRKKSPGFSTGFIQAIFQSPIIANQLLNLMVGSTFKRINVKQIQNFFVPMPRTHEQASIATVLSDVDALLDSLDQLITKKRNLKQAAMQQLLTGQTRLPGFEGKWEVKRLGNLASLCREHIVPAAHPTQLFVHFSLPAFDDGKIPVIEEGIGIGSNKFCVPQDAVLVSKLNPRIPRIWAPSKIPQHSIASTEFLVLVPVQAVSRSFLYSACSSLQFCEQMELAATGTTGSHQRTNPMDALNIRISVPMDTAEQTAIVTILSDMDAEIDTLEQRRTKTRQLKQAMMQELLTGRIRLV